MASALVAAAAWRMLHSRLLAALAAAIFLSSPIVLAGLSTDLRRAASMLVPVAWLLAMLVSVERTDARAAAVAGVIAALGLYLRPASLITMPLLMACAAAGIAIRHEKAIALRQLAWLAAAFTAVATPAAIALASQPSQVTQLILSHGLYDATTYNVLQGLREMFSWVGLVARSEAYWNYFDPSPWFFSDARVFLAPLALPVALGLYRLMVPVTAASWLVLSGLAVAAVPHMLIARPVDQSRLLMAAPFVPLLAVAGIAWVARAARR